jgi:hypothetical protein
VVVSTGKLVAVHNTKAYREQTDTALLSLNFGTRQRTVVNIMLWPLHPQGKTTVCIE